jgi:UDP-4-amino-4,6-dideoxy-N-acetyl-beta-L-altrosamine N-acetyltransferase
MTQDDLLMVLTWRNHSDVRRFMYSPHEITLTEHREWFARASHDMTRRLLIVEISKQALGFVQFSQVADSGTADWGFYVSPEAPKGSGRMLGVAALNYAFDSLNLKKVYGQVISSNQSSIAFHQRMGFALEEVLPDKQLINGTYCSLHCFVMLAADWRPESLLKE